MSELDHEHVMDEDGVCSCGHEHEEDALITMVDEETGEEFTFLLADQFEFEGSDYCLLLTVDEEEDAAIFVRAEEQEDGTQSFVSLEEEDFDRIADAYDALCEEAEAELEE